MRLIHTSDWHLGQTLHQFDRVHEHGRFLDWLLDTLVAEEADALLVAGDVFDNANPSSVSQVQLYRFLTEARRRVPHLNIVLTAGNHDSPARLEAPAPFLALLDAAVVGHVARAEEGADPDRLLVPLRDASGEIRAWCIAMPFLRPGDLPRVEGAEDPYSAGIEALYRQAFALAKARRAPGQAIVAMGHCHLTGGQVSEESERRIVIGGAEALPAAIFDPGIAYVALGHLHLAQRVGADGTRRYSGSPLPMSFSEIAYPHQVLVVDLAGEAVEAVREVRIPRAVELLRVPERPAPLVEVLRQLSALALPEKPETEWPYLLVRVQLTQPEPGLRAEIEAALEGKPVRLARIETRYGNQGSPELAPLLSVDDLDALAPADFFQRLYLHRFGEAAPAPLMAAFTELLNATPEVPAA
jgi:exonuclease SbcD